MGKAKIKKEKLLFLLKKFYRGIALAIEGKLRLLKDPDLGTKELHLDVIGGIQEQLEYMKDLLEILETLKNNKKVEVS